MTSSPPITKIVKLSYGVGAVGNGIKNITFSAYLMFFYNQVVGVPAAIISTALALTLIVDAFVDPFLGRWSDTFKSKWGRRHPFIYGAAVPTAIFFAFVWFPPAGLTDAQLGIWVFATAMLTRVSISAFEINSQALTPELTASYEERTKLFSLRYWFLYLGQYGFGTFCLLVFFHATPEFPKGQLNPDSYVGLAIFGSILIFISMIACGMGTHSRIPHLRQMEELQSKLSFRTHVSETLSVFKNRAFRAIFGFGVLKYTAIGLYSAMALYFNTYLFELNAGQLALLTLDSLVAATIAAPLAPVMSHWLGKRASSMIFAVVGISLGLSPLYLSYFGLFYAPGDAMLVPTMFVIGAIYGAMIAISLINTTSMLADVVEDAAVQSGHHQPGVFFAAASFMQQCSVALGIMFNGFILSLADFPQRPQMSQVTPAMMDTLLSAYLPIQFALWTLGCIFLLFYPITKLRHYQNIETLRQRAASKLHRSSGPVSSPDCGPLQAGTEMTTLS